MAKKSTASKRSAREQSTPVELTEKEVHEAREGKGTHELPGESREKDHTSRKDSETKKPTS